MIMARLTCIGVSSLVLWLPGCFRTGVHQGADASRYPNGAGGDPARVSLPSDCGPDRCDAAADVRCSRLSPQRDPDCECDPLDLQVMSCNEHPGYDGVGTCRAGTRPCIDGHWGACTGDVGPSIEACSPTAPDSNCSGVSGDGAGCTSRLTIYSELEQTACNSEKGEMQNDDYETAGQMVGGVASPGDGWVALSTFNVFKNPGADMVPVHNCRASRYWSSDWYDYVVVGETCSNLDNSLEWEDLGIVGYVSKVPAPGYRALSQVLLRYSYYGSSGFIRLAETPVSECPAKCHCLPLSVYVIP